MALSLGSLSRFKHEIIPTVETEKKEPWIKGTGEVERDSPNKGWAPNKKALCIQRSNFVGPTTGKTIDAGFRDRGHAYPRSREAGPRGRGAALSSTSRDTGGSCRRIRCRAWWCAAPVVVVLVPRRCPDSRPMTWACNHRMGARGGPSSGKAKASSWRGTGGAQSLPRGVNLAQLHTCAELIGSLVSNCHT